MSRSSSTRVRFDAVTLVKLLLWVAIIGFVVAVFVFGAIAFIALF